MPNSKTRHQLHFILIPFMSPSHIIPVMDFARLLSQRGLTLSIITTPGNASTIQSIIDRAQKSTHVKMGLATVPFPAQEVGLPQGCENMEAALSSPNKTKKFFMACNMLQEPIQKLLGELQPRPSCIISSTSLPWSAKVASNLKIPRYSFQTISIFCLVLGQNVGRMNVAETVTSDTEPFVVQNMPDEIVLTKSQMPQQAAKGGGEDMKKVIDQIIEAELLSRGMVVNSFYEMEPKYVEAQRNLGRKVWCIGPVSLCNKEMSDKLDRGNKASIDADVCLKWLDSMEPSSVIYTCFGSLGRIPSAQIVETGLGLESSNHPFIWIIRKKDVSSQVEKWLEEEKFEERVKGRGLIIRGWAPQVLILSHPSVGGFLTHCGWNSTLEAVCAGVPMITWPMFAEQFYNEKFIVNVLKIGVRTGVEVPMKMGEEEEEEDNKVYVSWGQLKQAIGELMDPKEKGERIKRARELREMAKKATEEGGSSYLNTTMLIQDVVEQLNEASSMK